MNKLTSNRRLLLTSIVTVVSLVAIIILSTTIHLINDREQSHLTENTKAWADALAKASVVYLQENKKDGHKKLKALLKKIISAPYINYVHIYAINNEQLTNFYAGYNKSAYFPAIPDKINEIKQLSTINFQKNYIELIVNIEQGQKVYGYLYIQSNLKGVNDFVEKIIYISLFFILFAVVAAILLAHLLQRRINEPLDAINAFLQQICQTKNYSQRLSEVPIVELDILGQNINILLSRTQKHLLKLENIHEQTLKQNATLADKVSTRTNALKESNQELLSTLEKLHQFQGKLVENEKMASLGDMVAGIAHEVNTPIGLGVTASTLMTDKLNEIKLAFENKTLKSSQLKKFLSQGQENLAIIYRNLERAAKLISSFKKVAVDQSSSETRQFKIKELLDEVLLTLKAKIDEEQVKVVLVCDETLAIESKPGPLNQIFINLIMNSIIHGFEHKNNGQVNISIVYLSHQLHISYQDDGIGINDNIRARIFEPFTTTKRGSGGSGLGLHLVYNLVTQALNGQIDFHSNAGEGTTFEITIPVNLVSPT